MGLIYEQLRAGQEAISYSGSHRASYSDKHYNNIHLHTSFLSIISNNLLSGLVL